MSPDYDALRHTVRVVGRDLTCDLIDGSAVHKTWQWHNVKIDQLARDLIAPYKLKLIVDADIGEPFPSYNIQEGESVFECLSRAARLRALLLTSTPDGDLLITRAGKETLDTGLAEGDHIKAARADFNWAERYSKYIVKGQSRLGWDGETEHAASSGEVVDERITRPRPLIVLADTQGDNATLAERAEWERNVRRGRSVRGSITVQGWQRPDGKLWMPNALVPVTSPLLWLTQPAALLIVGCTYTMDDRSGTLTELAIARPEAFELLEGVSQSKLFGKLNTKTQREKREKFDDWSML